MKFNFFPQDKGSDTEFLFLREDEISIATLAKNCLNFTKWL